MIMLSLLFIDFLFIVNAILSLVCFMFIFICFFVLLTQFSELFLVILIINASPFSNHNLIINIILLDCFLIVLVILLVSSSFYALIYTITFSLIMPFPCL